jgi:hypothetical protein
MGERLRLLPTFSLDRVTTKYKSKWVRVFVHSQSLTVHSHQEWQAHTHTRDSECVGAVNVVYYTRVNVELSDLRFSSCRACLVLLRGQ